MLRRGIGVGALVALALTFLMSAPASAARCVAWEKSAVDSSTGGFTIVCAMYVYDDGGGGNGGGNDSGGNDEPRKCYRDDYGGGHELPCENKTGTWNDARQCYVGIADPQPRQSEEVWEGNTDGFILACDYPDVTGYDRGISYFWAASDPDDLLPSPRELADRAIVQMEMSSGRVGSTPPSTDVKGDSMGLIGVPMWFWAEDPDGTMDPPAETETAGSITVTATPRLERTVWTMARRDTGAVVHTVTCSGDDARGTRWSAERDGDGTLPSPTCGLPAGANDQPGEYSLSAQAYWVVDWTGGGEDGSVPINPPASPSVPIDVAELQTIIVD